MNLAQVVFGFFVLLAATSNFAFFVGDLDDPSVHSGYMLFFTLVVNLVTTALKVPDRTHRGAFYLATSLVADVQLVAAAVCWIAARGLSAGDLSGGTTAVIVSLSGGALVANVVSVTLLLAETVSVPRR
jgi:hypothetical protein